jgi:high-affinity iron transporter
VSNAVLASYLIGLREGLEGTLVVSILVAYLVKSGRRERLPHVWAGVGAALALSIAFGAGLTYTGVVLGAKKELFEAVTSVVAVTFVTWMIFWMRRTARRLKGDLTTRMEEALKLGAVAVVAMAFLTVAREGLETALQFFAAVQGATTQAGPLLGISAGVLTAVVLGYLLYRAAIRINLGRFFTWTGVLLVLVAAGIFKYGVHDFQESGVLPGLNTYAFDISSWYDPNAWYAALLTGMFNLTAQPTVAETIGWVGYAAVVLTFFLWPSRAASKPAPQPKEVKENRAHAAA